MVFFVHEYLSNLRPCISNTFILRNFFKLKTTITLLNRPIRIDVQKNRESNTMNFNNVDAFAHALVSKNNFKIWLYLKLRDIKMSSKGLLFRKNSRNLYSQESRAVYERVRDGESQNLS